MFDLSSISNTRRNIPLRMLLSGEPKIGKSTFAASAPKAIGILTEDGLAGIEAQAFPVCQSLADVYQCLSTLIGDAHEFQTLFLDSLDWLEPLLHAHVCQVQGWADIETPGFGKGYVAAATEWKVLLEGLDTLREDRGMNVILVSHVKQQRIELPTHDGFDAYVLKLHARAAALVQEWADVVGFAAHRIALRKTDVGFGNKETKSVATGERLLYLAPNPAYPSGSRFGLHDCPLSWDAFAAQLSQATT